VVRIQNILGLRNSLRQSINHASLRIARVSQIVRNTPLNGIRGLIRTVKKAVSVLRSFVAVIYTLPF
jgi:hypothetical protein